MTWVWLSLSVIFNVFMIFIVYLQKQDINQLQKDLDTSIEVGNNYKNRLNNLTNELSFFAERFSKLKNKITPL